MKKSVIITISICVIAFVLLVGVGGFFLVRTILNQEKDPITVEEFKSTMQDKGYTIIDAKKQFENYDYIKSAYIAMSSNGEYQIEFYKMSDEKNATNFYEHNKSKFESSASSPESTSYINMNKYSKCTILANGDYMVVSRIKDTVIYLNVDARYKNQIKDLLKEIGY